MAQEVKAVAYTRVSSSEQLREGFSVPAQRSILHEYAERHRLTIVAEFTDDETAKTTGRTDFSRMVAHLRAHPDHVLIAEKTDRLYRNIRDYLTIDELGVELHFAKEGGKDRKDSDARFMHLLRVGMARKYVENLSEEVKKGLRRKCEEGGWPTWAPLGYVNVKDAIEKKRTGGIVPDPLRAHLVREIYEAASTGAYSLADLVKLADKIGLRGKYGTKITKPTMAYIVSNVAYTGIFSWSGKTYRGKFEPIIADDLFDRVQQVLGDASRSKTRQHTFTYAGICRCGTCGGILTGQIQKGRYVYYACRGGADCKRYYPESVFDAAAADALGSLAIDDARSEWIMRELARWFDGGADKESARADRVRARLKEISNLRTASYEEKLLGRISEEIWQSVNARWKDEDAGLCAELATLKPAIERAAFLKMARDPFELAQTAAGQYLRQNAAEKGRLMKTCCSNLIVTEGSVSIQLRSPFHIIAKMAGCTDWLASLDDYRTAILMMRSGGQAA